MSSRPEWRQPTFPKSGDLHLRGRFTSVPIRIWNRTSGTTIFEPLVTADGLRSMVQLAAHLRGDDRYEGNAKGASDANNPAHERSCNSTSADETKAAACAECR